MHNCTVLPNSVSAFVFSIGRLPSKILFSVSSPSNLNSNVIVFFVPSISSISFSPTVYDKYGYVIAYKATVNLLTKYEGVDKKPEQFTTSGEYDFSIAANSVISDTSRYEAIKYAASDALDEFVSRIAIKGLRNGNNNQ